MSIGIHLDTSTIPVSIGGTAAAPASDGSSPTTPVTKDGSASATVQASNPSDDSDSNANPAVKALKKEIAQLQKQLTQEEQALHAAMVAMKGVSDPASLTVIATLESAVATTNGQLEMAVTALSTLLLSQGGGSSGSLVNASA